MHESNHNNFQGLKYEKNESNLLGYVSYIYPLRIFTAVGSRSQLLENTDFDQQYPQRNETSHRKAVERYVVGGYRRL
jgi:hypothetical protein